MRRPDRHRLLELHHRGPRPRPLHPARHLGLQRHRASRGRDPGRRGRRLQHAGHPLLRHLRPRRAGRRRLGPDRRRRREHPALRARRPGGRPHEGAQLPLDRDRLHGDRRLPRPRAVLRRLPGHARRVHRHDRDRPPYRPRHLRPPGVRVRPGLGPGAPHHRGEPQPRGQPLHPGGVRRAVRLLHQDAPHRPRPHGGQPRPGRAGLRRRGRGPRRHRGGLPGAASVDGLQAQRRHPRDLPQHHLRLERQAAREGLRHGGRRRQRRGHALQLRPDSPSPALQRRAHLLEPRGC